MESSSRSGAAPSLKRWTSPEVMVSSPRFSKVKAPAVLSASASRVGQSEGAQDWRARRRAALSPVGDCFTSVLAPARRIIICSPSRRPSIHCKASARAFSKRLGFSSVACIEAEPSRMTTRRRLSCALPARKGRIRAKTTRASRRSCSRSSQLCRSLWNGALAWVSARNLCQSSVLDTSFTTRLRLRR